MDCRILRMLTLKSNGDLVCDDSSGYGIVLGEVSTGIGWNIRKVIEGPIYAHVRRSFAEGRAPWPEVCPRCHTFSEGGVSLDTLDSRMRLMVEPTLSCRLGCPSCMRKREGKVRTGSWDLEPEILEVLLRSCCKSDIEIEEVHYLGWGEPLLYERLPELTKLVRHWHPFAVQETTTSGSIDDPRVLDDLDLDKLTISCDGIEQNSYERYRRGGTIEKVFSLFEHISRIKNRPYVEWKYILFDHNDTEREIIEAQRLADEFELDSILFIITHSKKASQRFTIENIRDFPLVSDRSSISPAAGIMTVKHTGRVLQEASVLGDLNEMSLFIDQVQVTTSDILELRGWSMRSDGGHVDTIKCYQGPSQIGTAKLRERRRDVQRARPHAMGPDMGFTIKIPLRERAPIRSLHFLVSSGNMQQEFSAAFTFDAVN